MSSQKRTFEESFGAHQKAFNEYVAKRQEQVNDALNRKYSVDMLSDLEAVFGKAECTDTALNEYSEHLTKFLKRKTEVLQEIYNDVKDLDDPRILDFCEWEMNFYKVYNSYSVEGRKCIERDKNKYSVKTKEGLENIKNEYVYRQSGLLMGNALYGPGLNFHSSFWSEFDMNAEYDGVIFPKFRDTDETHTLHFKTKMNGWDTLNEMKWWYSQRPTKTEAAKLQKQNMFLEGDDVSNFTRIDFLTDMVCVDKVLVVSKNGEEDEDESKNTYLYIWMGS
jgi:hypothetical protein